jgi:hypothetical protein
MAGQYAHNSTYAFSENRVVDGIELEGLEVTLKPFDKFTYGDNMSLNVVTFIDNSLISAANGVISMFNATTYFSNVNTPKQAVDKVVDDVVSYAKETTKYYSGTSLSKQIDNAKKEFTEVETYEDLAGGLISTYSGTKLFKNPIVKGTSSKFSSLSQTGKIDPKTIRFSQSSIKSEFKDGGTIDNLTKGLINGKIRPKDVSPIRIVEYKGNIYTLDNRRLKAFQDANMKIRYTKLDYENLPQKEKDKFTTKNNGSSIKIRGKK